MKWFTKAFNQTKPAKRTRKSPKLIVMNDKTFEKDLEKRMIGVNPTRLTGDFIENAVRGSISNAVRGAAEAQRDYARTLALNNPQIKRAVQYQVDNAVGSDGINPQPRIMDSNGNLNKVVNRKINDQFKLWSQSRKRFSLNHKHNWRSFSLLIEAARYVDGEVFIRIHESDNDFKIEIIGSERVPFYEMSSDETTYTRHGITYDRETGIPVSYKIREMNRLTDTPTGNLIVVPANEVIHYYIEKFVGQERGISELTSIMETTIQYGEFLKYAIVQKRQSASSAGFIIQDKESKQDIELGLGLDDDDHDEYVPPEIVQEIEAGMLQKLPAGHDVKQFVATQGADDAASFANLLDGHLAMGLNFYLQGWKGDTSGINYSSARFGDQVQKGSFRNVQSTLQEVVLLPIYEKWITYMIRTEQFDFKMGAIDGIVSSTAWTFPRRESIDPVKDTQNDVMLIDNGIKSASQVILERGDDPEQVFAEVNAEKDRYVPKHSNKIEVAQAPAIAAAETESENGN
ncbi:phage portal protein [Serratia marcescens]|uniref:phage portal protein n=1 Tax=Serratia marcescens TaxID=615 RepID=UPI0010685BE8|nr:phage portal protein [Serratia marcescens]TEW83371.1 phage portal protein [Serratia marcescens]